MARDVPRVLPLAEAIPRVQLAKCWKPRGSDGTRRCHTACLGSVTWAVTNREVRAISRKGQVSSSGFVGFVDGEGCFSVPIFKNRSCRIGWQVQPEFSVVQGARSVQVLHELERFFACGHVGRNSRHDNHREDLYRYSVRSTGDLVGRIIPFFEAHSLRTAKRQEFIKFATVVRLMSQHVHLSVEGLIQIARIAETMNHRKPSRFLESSEAIRQPPRLDERGEDMVRATWRHVEDSSEIPCRVSSLAPHRGDSV